MHFKEYRFLEVILDTKHLKHKTLLNKSISLFWCEHLFSIDSKYFSFEGYTCKSTLSVNLSVISKQGGDVQMTHRMHYAQKRQNKYFKT